MRLNTFDYIAWILVLVGGLNWGLVGIFDYNLVASLFGADSALTRIVYSLVGLAALYLVVKLPSAGRTQAP